VPSPPVGGVANATNLDRVPVGVLDGSGFASVDPRGLVTPEAGNWSLDWWVGADDRWHLPSREVAVRQALVDGAPVVETSMRVPGGDVVERVWMFRDTAAGEMLAVEIENASRLPVAIALAVRPYGPDGAGQIGTIEVGGRTVRVDGITALLLPKEQARVATSTLAEGDVADLVTTGEAADQASATAECPAGFTSAALIFPLAHTASLRVLLPVTSSRGLDAASAVVPPSDAVARGWVTHATRGARIELPDPDLQATFTAASMQVLLASGGRELAGESSTTETAAVVGALDRLGLHDEAGSIVATVPLGQGAGGRLGGTDPATDATGAALVAAGRHWRIARDSALLAELAGPLAAGAHHHRRGGWRSVARGAPRGDSVVDLGWRLRGILDVAAALSGSDQVEAAGELVHLADAVQAELTAALDQAELAPETLALASPLGVLDPSSPAVGRVLDRIRQRHVHDGGVVSLAGATGVSPELTALVGRTELRRGEDEALERIDWMVRAGGSTHTWSDRVHPRLGTGCGGGGWSPPAAAAFVDLVLDLVVHEAWDQPPGGHPPHLVLCALWPGSWIGAGLEVHQVPTTLGRVSFAIRWHGERPALLWELEPHPGVESVTITIPGLDPSWTTTELRGDALLAAPPHHDRSEPAAPVDGDSFS
jgi:hypothetical protein